MASPIVEELKRLEMDGFKTFDAFLEKEILVVAPVMCFIGDNPRASEIMNHLGPTSKKFCRICMVGFNCMSISSAIYLCLSCHFKVSRDDDPTIIGHLRSKSLTQQQLDAIQSEPVAKKRAALRTDFGIRESPNALIDLPIDFHRYINLIM